MSNPGVLTLTEKRIAPNKSFRVEDNLGESIHLHYNDIRVDLTIKELLYLGKESDKILMDRVKAKNFRPDVFEGNSLVDISEYLLDLEEVRYDEVFLSSLRYKGKILICVPVWRDLSKSNIVMSDVKRQIILFNDQPYIRFGAEYASFLYRNDPESKIQVLRLIFKENKHSEDPTPWKTFLFRWNGKRISDIVKSFLHRI